MDEDLKKIMERVPRYLRLGFTYRELLDKQLFYDDRLWEEAKELPIDEFNEIDCLNRELKKLNKLTAEEREDLERELITRIGRILDS